MLRGWTTSSWVCRRWCPPSWTRSLLSSLTFTVPRKRSVRKKDATTFQKRQLSKCCFIDQTRMRVISRRASAALRRPAPPCRLLRLLSKKLASSANYWAESKRIVSNAARVQCRAASSCTTFHLTQRACGSRPPPFVPSPDCAQCCNRFGCSSACKRASSILHFVRHAPGADSVITIMTLWPNSKLKLARTCEPALPDGWPNHRSSKGSRAPLTLITNFLKIVRTSVRCSTQKAVASVPQHVALPEPRGTGPSLQRAHTRACTSRRRTLQ